MSETSLTYDEKPVTEMTTGENFAELLKESLKKQEKFEGTVAKGHVVSIENDMVLVDVGLKSEGYIPLKEFTSSGEEADIKPGDEVDVFVVRLENRNGEAMLSRDRARREEAWVLLEKSFLSSAASRVVLPWISTVLWPSCPAPKWISAQCAMSRRSWTHPRLSRF